MTECATMFSTVISGAMMVLFNANDSRYNNLCCMRRGDSRFDNTSSFDDLCNISLLEVKFRWVQAVRFLMQVMTLPCYPCCVSVNILY